MIRNGRRTTTMGALVAAAGLLLAGCGGGDDETTDTPAAPAPTGAVSNAPTTPDVELVSDGKLTVCTSLPYAPFEANVDGKVQGLDVDLMDLVSAQLGVTTEIRDTGFDGIQSGAALNAGQCDIAAAGMTITPERQQSIDFSDPYFDANQALLSKKGSGITSLEAAEGKKLTSQEATTGEKYARDAGLDPVSVGTPDLQFNALKAGQADVAIQDLPVVSEWLKDPANADFEISATIETGEQYGFGVKKGNTALLDVVNSVLEGARTDGTYDEIYSKWIGEVPSAAATPAAG
ncbi:transporter substrate-binding domain-containing protein [Motilibacter aurantiacus]|uniref:transporter substrate-binding domain-containing protein n=1 Tax=Motilibacter aurantiacus TaxID=2714955 RepID=UPI001408263C|nr:transporter substrate-binding domain-containing protein [Motilibacter aurantiacus]NHC45193.1 transporter substrate-binding domain-containing protein [Motilibacter aurantiacus]